RQGPGGAGGGGRSPAPGPGGGAPGRAPSGRRGCGPARSERRPACRGCPPARRCGRARPRRSPGPPVSASRTPRPGTPPRCGARDAWGPPLQGRPLAQQPRRGATFGVRQPPGAAAPRATEAGDRARRDVTGIDGEELSGGGTPDESPLTRFHQRLVAEELSLRSGRATERLAGALSEAKVDLNPHQVEAAAFALDSLPRGG